MRSPFLVWVMLYFCQACCILSGPGGPWKSVTAKIDPTPEMSIAAPWILANGSAKTALRTRFL